MLYSFLIYNIGKGASISHVRTYESVELSETTLKNIRLVMEQAFKATGLLVGDLVNVAPELAPFNSYLPIDPWEKANGKIKTQDARAIAQQLLDDLVSAKYWKESFNGPDDSFTSLDFDTFSYIDESNDNNNLKVAIGEKVYVRGQNDKIYTYAGRPKNWQIKEGDTIIFESRRKNAKVFATDTNILAVNDFNVDEYMERMEVFPLPTMGTATKGLGNNRFFARTKPGEKVTYEALGKTDTEALMLLALQLAFSAWPTDNSRYWLFP